MSTLSKLGYWFGGVQMPCKTVDELFEECNISEQRMEEACFGVGELTIQEARAIIKYLNLTTEQQHQLLEFVPILED